MKKLKLLVLGFLTVISTVSANDNKESLAVQAVINVNSNDLVYLQLENPSQTRVYITIRDSKGVVLHGESTKKDSQMLKRYDMSNLPKGLYTCQVSNSSYNLERKIEIK